jgi:hypothetical protein
LAPCEKEETQQEKDGPELEEDRRPNTLFLGRLGGDLDVLL